jgi:HPt (histidine-containing phosphotransfer) domain-containing protein
MIKLATRTAASLAERITPMADDEQGTPGMVSGLTQMFVAQLRAVTEELENLAGGGERLPAARSALLLPGALSAAQVTSIADSVAAQRRSIEALKAQLSAFDEQLALLERILDPFAEWIRTWADVEEQLVTMQRRPEAEGS